MSTPYEVEHGVTAGQTGRRPQNRRVDMESFFSFLHQISTDAISSVSSETTPQTHNNRHAEATPVDTANLFRLLQDQFATLRQTSPDATNRDFLEALIQEVDRDIADLPRLHGVGQEFLDGLDRVSKKEILKGKKGEEKCPICAVKFNEDPHPLVVALPCHTSHCFDLECVAPWLQSKGTCPMCRKNFVRKKEEKKELKEDSEEEEEFDNMNGVWLATGYPQTVIAIRGVDEKGLALVRNGVEVL
ncbi:hypothetical protein MKZ38_001906 [Zalerion maritima]|uniref:RING-type domain-containing protein n=1 Tax=Zalerion maritima TaxID=339359 RepID=A0AAD5RX66_9PEZI|nr:hypothetical protein MKZ38_001906 [Zalerion maritima]